jgi:thiol:disulfide interchange protein
VVRVLFIICSVMLSSMAIAQQKPADTMAVPRPEAFDAQRDADKDIRSAVAQAASSGRMVLLDVGGEWCIWCKRLDAFFASHASVSEFLHRNFVVQKVNYSKENKNEAVLSRYPRIPGYPHLFILDGEGKLVHSQDTGVLEEGKGYSEEKITAFLEKWAPKREAH